MNELDGFILIISGIIMGVLLGYSIGEYFTLKWIDKKLQVLIDKFNEKDC